LELHRRLASRAHPDVDLERNGPGAPEVSRAVAGARRCARSLGRAPVAIPFRRAAPGLVHEVHARVDDATVARQLGGRHAVVGLQVPPGEVQRDGLAALHVEDEGAGIATEGRAVVRQCRHRLAEALYALASADASGLEPLDVVDAAEDLRL